MSIGRIYKIYNNVNDKIYIGSTTRSVKERLLRHKYDYKRYLNNKHSYITSFEIIKNEPYFIEELEEIECIDKKQLYKKEREYIENNNCVNKTIPTRTMKEYCEDNKEKINKYFKEYYEDNKEKINKKNIKYHQDNKDKINKYNEDNKERKKKNDKEYYEDNKQEINEKRKIKINCNICDSVVRKSDIARHQKSIKCQNYKKEIIN